MISNELYYSDIVCVGGRVLSIDSFHKEFPDWYETWISYHGNKNNDTCILISDYDYGISATLNVLYRINFEKAEADILCRLEGGEYGGVYQPPIHIGNQLILAPCRSKKWAYFDLKTEHWTYMDVPQRFYHKSDDVFICSWKPIRDSLVCLSQHGIIARLDFKSGEITYHDCLRKIISDRELGFSAMAMITYKSSILFYSDTSDRLYELDTDRMEITGVHRVGHNIRGIKAMCAIPKTDWIFFIKSTDKTDSGDIRSVYKWNISTNDLVKIDRLPINPCGDDEENLLAGFLYYKGDLYVTPLRGDCFIRIIMENNLTERIEIDTGHNLLERKNSFYKRWGDNVAFPLFTYNGFVNAFAATLPYDFSVAEIDFENKRLLNRRKWRVNGIDELLKKQLTIRLDDGCCYENDFCSLRDFIGDLL